MGGLKGWAWTIQSGKNIAMAYSKSRGSLVMDTYMGKYGGVSGTDGYGVYKRFDAGGRHQICWTHELRNARHTSEKTGAAEESRLLYEDLKWAFEEAKSIAEHAHCQAAACHELHAVWHTGKVPAHAQRAAVKAGQKAGPAPAQHVHVSGISRGGAYQQLLGACTPLCRGVSQDKRTDQGRRQGHEAHVQLCYVRADMESLW